MNQKEEIEKLIEAAKFAKDALIDLYPHCHESNMKGETEYEKVWLNCEKALQLLQTAIPKAGYAAATPSAPESYKSFLPVLEENYEACKKGAEKYHDSELDKIQYQAIVREYEELISIYKSFYSAPSPSIEAGLPVNAFHAECPKCGEKIDVIPPANTVIKSEGEAGLRSKEEMIPFEMAREAVQVEIKSNKEYEKYCQQLESLWRDVNAVLDADLSDAGKIKIIKERVQLFDKQIKI